MNIAGEQLLTADCRLPIEFSDASEREFWKFLAPQFFQAHSITRRNGEEEFVIFAVGNCLLNAATGRKRQSALVNGETKFARARQPGQVRAKAIAQVHHGVHFEICRQPARFVDSRDKPQMPATNRTTQFSGNEKIVVRFATAAQNAAVAFDKSRHTNNDHCRTSSLAGFSPNDSDVKTRRGAIETAIELAHR